LQDEPCALRLYILRGQVEAASLQPIAQLLRVFLRQLGQVLGVIRVRLRQQDGEEHVRQLPMGDMQLLHRRPRSRRTSTAASNAERASSVMPSKKKLVGTASRSPAMLCSRLAV